LGQTILKAKLPRRQFLHLAAGAAALPAFSDVTRAQAYPTRPIRLLVPFAPGGGTDYAARAVGVYLSRAFGQQVIVENKPGAGGLIGIETAAKSPPDGYTALISADTLASAPAVTNLNTDYIKDLVPVIHLTSNPVILSVHSSLPAAGHSARTMSSLRPWRLLPGLRKADVASSSLRISSVE
jgi:tripartite-type tricarboxylate transporter receptor subunit TctC